MLQFHLSFAILLLLQHALALGHLLPRSSRTVHLSLRSGSSQDAAKDNGEIFHIDYHQTLALGERIANHSWEFGTMSMASLEANNPSLTVFSPHAFPFGTIPRLANGAQDVDAVRYAQKHILVANDTLSDGQGALGDPASLGIVCLLLAFSRGNQSQSNIYMQAAKRQFDHIQQAKRYVNGAISQRESVAELWADAVYMLPPFLAYYGVAVDDEEIVRQAVEQCGLYRDVLSAPTVEEWQGLWQHIVGPESQTLGIWATGNGWAALGMVRVLATVMHWPKSREWSKEQADLTGWLMEIFTGLRHVDRDPKTGFWRNYLVGGADSSQDHSVDWFGDGAGSSALVAAALRLAVLQPHLASTLISLTRPVRIAIMNHIDGGGKITPTMHLVKRLQPLQFPIGDDNSDDGDGDGDDVDDEEEGKLAPTVNPLDWHTTEPFFGGSPEGQAFATMVGAAWRDCIWAGICSPEE